MSKKDIITIIGVLLGCTIIFIGGIYVGKKTTPVKEIIKTVYVKGETIHDTITKPYPVEIIKPVDTANIIKQCVADGIFYELFPEKHVTDTIYMSKLDTTIIMADWATKREYRQQLFDIDTVGKLNIVTYTQYNRLGDIQYTFTPIYKQETTTVILERKLTPYVGLGLTTLPSYNAEVGLFYHKSWGVAVEGNYYPKLYSEDFPRYSIGMKVLKMF